MTITFLSMANIANNSYHQVTNIYSKCSTSQTLRYFHGTELYMFDITETMIKMTDFFFLTFYLNVLALTDYLTFKQWYRMLSILVFVYLLRKYVTKFHPPKFCYVIDPITNTIIKIETNWHFSQLKSQELQKTQRLPEAHKHLKNKQYFVGIPIWISKCVTRGVKNKSLHQQPIIHNLQQIFKQV